jgi:tetratricopeptide (TPR) repeat protein
MNDISLRELEQRVEADEFRALAERRQQSGDREDAAVYYQMSLELFPTAEAHVGLGTVLASRGQWMDAIGQCAAAIRIDPEFGDAYNDTGVYLLELGDLDAALDWLDKAIAAPRGNCRHYPHYHRAQILERQAKFVEARNALLISLKIAPEWEPAQAALHRVLSWLN